MRAHEFITEVFDSPYELVTDTPATDDVKRSIRNNGDGLRGLMVYQIKDDPSNIFFLIFTDGYWEVHHVYDDGVNYSSGETLNLSISPNVKFFSTILELYMNRLNKGHRIRIVGRNPQQWNTYSAAINHIIKKHPEDYVVSEVDYNHVDLQGHKSISQTVGLRGNGWATKLNEYRKSLHNEST